MCGRYYRTSTLEQIEDAFQAGAAGDGLAYAPGYNIGPTTTQPVVRQIRGTAMREIVPMRWGLVGFHSKGVDPKRSTFNARAESVQASSFWRGPLHRHRCLVPLDGYLEWRKPERTPFRFTLAEPSVFALAGLWDAWQNPADCKWLQSFAIITTSANALAREVHDRMPVIVHCADYEQWLDHSETEHPPVELLAPYEAEDMRRHEAHPGIGNIRDQSPEMLNSS